MSSITDYFNNPRKPRTMFPAVPSDLQIETSDDGYALITATERFPMSQRQTQRIQAASMEYMLAVDDVLHRSVTTGGAS